MKAAVALNVCVVLFFSSCAVLSKTETAKTTGIYGPGVLQYPVLADLDVKESKVTGTATGRSSATADVKNLAVADAIKKANADVLVEPVFDLQTKGSTVTANVSGFPGTYKNFRPVSQSDLPMLETGVLQKAQVAEVSDAPVKKKSPAGVVFGVLLAIVVVVGLVL